MDGFSKRLARAKVLGLGTSVLRISLRTIHNMPHSLSLPSKASKDDVIDVIVMDEYLEV